MEIADAGIQVAPLNVTGPAIGIRRFGLVKEDVELLCLTSTTIGMRYDIFSKRLFPAHEIRGLRNDAFTAAKCATCTVYYLRRVDPRRLT